MEEDKAKRLENFKKIIEIAQEAKSCVVVENIIAHYFELNFLGGEWYLPYLKNGISDKEFKERKKQIKEWKKQEKERKIIANTITISKLKDWIKNKDRKAIILFEQILQWQKEEETLKINNSHKIKKNIIKIKNIPTKLRLYKHNGQYYLLGGYKAKKENICFYDHLQDFKKKHGFLPKEFLVDRKAKTISFVHEKQNYIIKLKNYDPAEEWYESCKNYKFPKID